MKIHGMKRTFQNPFYVNFKKHYCPDCNVRLIKIKVSKVVNWKSEEAKNFDFSACDSFMIGNIKFIWTEFQCPECKRQITIDEMKRIEKEKFKKNIKGENPTFRQLN